MQVLAKPGTVKAHQKFEAEIYALTKEEGGRHTPFMTNYSPQFFFRTANVTGSVILDEERQMVLPGDNCKVVCELLAPVAIDEGMRFAFREGGRCERAPCDAVVRRPSSYHSPGPRLTHRTVGAGVVSKVLS